MKIGIVLPSRNRPMGLRRMVESILDLAAKPDRVKIFAGLDDDDPTLGEIGELPNTEKVVRPPEITCARMIDNLAFRAEREVDATLRMDDDFICETSGWDDNCECMTGLGFWRIHDATHARGFMSFAGMSVDMAKWLRKHQSFVHAPWFPFWFTDTWLNEIGDMSGMKAPVMVSMVQPEGRGVTHGLRDIRFWAELFEGFRPARVMVAADLIRDAYPQGIIRESALFKLPERAQECANNVAHLRGDEFVAMWGSKAETFSGTSDARYRQAKAEAETIRQSALARAA